MSWFSFQSVQIEHQARLYKAAEAQRQHDLARLFACHQPLWKRLFRR